MDEISPPYMMRGAHFRFRNFYSIATCEQHSIKKYDLGRLGKAVPGLKGPI